MKKFENKHGFTIVELLIVIVVIAILAAISVVAYNGMQTRAKAASAVTAFKNAAKGMQLYKTETGKTTWWLDNEFTGSANPQVKTVITNTNLKNYVQDVTLPGSMVMQYDNDNDTYDGCSASATGVKLFSYNTPQEIAQVIDDSVDDGNLTCGRVTWSAADGNGISYYLANQSSQ